MLHNIHISIVQQLGNQKFLTSHELLWNLTQYWDSHSKPHKYSSEKAVGRAIPSHQEIQFFQCAESLLGAMSGTLGSYLVLGHCSSSFEEIWISNIKTVSSFSESGNYSVVPVFLWLEGNTSINTCQWTASRMKIAQHNITKTIRHIHLGKQNYWMHGEPNIFFLKFIKIIIFNFYKIQQLGFKTFFRFFGCSLKNNLTDHMK